MTSVEVSLPVASQPSIDAFVDQAQRAESAGYNRIWLPETWGRDVVTMLATIAARTDDIGIGPSIMPIYSRSPALIAQTAATLQEVSNGRFRLGLGPSGPLVIQNWHGMSFERPLRYTRETIEIITQVFSGDPVNYDGELFDLSEFRLRCSPPEPRPRVDAAGMGPKSVELAGRFADGWHALMLTPDGFRDRMADLRRGADRGNRDPTDVRTTLSLTCCVCDDGERARRLVRQHIVFYIGSMGTFYRDAIARQGYEEIAREIHEKWQQGDREDAMNAMPDELLDRLAVAGTPAVARDRFDAFAAIDDVDAISVSFPRACDRSDIDATLDTLAPE